MRRANYRGMNLYRLLALLVALTIAPSGVARAQFAPSDYAQRRAALLAKIPDGIAVKIGLGIQDQDTGPEGEGVRAAVRSERRDGKDGGGGEGGERSAGGDEDADIIYTFWVKSAICHSGTCQARSGAHQATGRQLADNANLPAHCQFLK